MTRLQTTHNGLLRDMTDDEIAQYHATVAEAELEASEIEARKQQKQSALAKLAALGLTADEIKALVG